MLSRAKRPASMFSGAASTNSPTGRPSARKIAMRSGVRSSPRGVGIKSASPSSTMASKSSASCGSTPPTSRMAAIATAARGSPDFARQNPRSVVQNLSGSSVGRFFGKIAVDLQIASPRPMIRSASAPTRRNSRFAAEPATPARLAASSAAPNRSKAAARRVSNPSASSGGRAPETSARRINAFTRHKELGRAVSTAASAVAPDVPCHIVSGNPLAMAPTRPAASGVAVPISVAAMPSSTEPESSNP